MSQASNSQTKKRSKIPLFYGTRKTPGTATRMVSTDSKLTALRQGTEKMAEPTCRRQILRDTENNRNAEEINEIPFEADQQALDSILNNQGIVPGVTVKASTNALKVGKVSSVFERPAPNRMSMMESLTDFKKSMKVYKEKMQQLNINTKFESDPKALKSILDGQGITPTAITKRSSIYYQPPANRTSMIESYEAFKENVKIFRAKMKKLDSATPSDAGRVASKTTSNQGKGGATNHQQFVRSVSSRSISTTPDSSASSLSRSGSASLHARAWSASKEKKTPTLTNQRPFSSSTSKLISNKMASNGLKSSDSAEKANISNWGGKSCQKRLSALFESPEASGQQLVNNLETASMLTDGKLETKLPVSEDLNSMNRSTKSQGVQSSGMQNIICSAAPKSCFIVQTCSSSISDGSSSSRFVMSNSKPICAPAQVAQSENILGNSKSETASGNGISSTTNSAPVTTAGGMSVISHSLIVPTSQGSDIKGTSQHFSVPIQIKEKDLEHLAASSLTDKPLCNSPDQTPNTSLQNDTQHKELYHSVSTTSYSQGHAVSSQMNSFSTPLLQFPVRSTAVSTTTPTLKALRVPVRHCTPSPASRIPVMKNSPSPCLSSPFTPRNVSYLNRPPMRTPALSSCLKSKTNNMLHLRNASSTVKKLRWADTDS